MTRGAAASPGLPVAALALALLGLACSGAPQPVAAAPDDAAAAADPMEAGTDLVADEAEEGDPAPAPLTPPATLPAPRRQEARPPQRPPVVTIESGGEEAAEGTGLVAAAEAERQRRRAGEHPVLVITDENLEQHASGNLTFMDADATDPAASAVDPEVAEAAAAAAELSDQEQHWRSRVRELRQEWRDAVDHILALEGRANALRTSFYSEDDPYLRDGQIKPAWDRTLDSIAEAKARGLTLEQQLGYTLEEGRAKGALPGWLREGIDLEPEVRPYPSAADSGEPEEPVGEPEVIEADDGEAWW
ncbi:MAG TPA: hypothetical protein VMT16_00940 [Thermoanaerobaculia bacterium]|nr:hypothetical protein [Thermoanaerobaculia bacterium]